jgi:hypothetical protein
MLLKHFTTWQPDKIDFEQTYSASWDESFYWKNKQINTDDSKEVAEGIIRGIEVILKKIDTTVDLSFVAEELKKSRYYSELLKEYIFEDVRINEFPDKPSRKKSMFLSPNEIDVIEYAKGLGYKTETKFFYEIELIEKLNIHFADLSFLNCTTSSHEQKVDNARRYWEGTEKRDFNTEILFQGQFKILRTIKE